MDKLEYYSMEDGETGEVKTLQISDPEAIKTDTAIAFTEADTKSNIESGENIPTLFGKIKKWFSSLKAVAFSGSYNDLEDKPELPELDPVATSGDYNDLKNKPDLKDVATSGDYADLINTPDVFSTTTNGLVPISTDVEGFLKGDGTWAVPKGGTDQQFLTWEEWEALPDTKYTDNVRYIITNKTYRDGIIQDDKTGDTITWSSNKIVNYISQLPEGFQLPDGWSWTSGELATEYYTYNRDRCSISLIAGVNGPYIYIYQANKGTASIEPNHIEVFGSEYDNYVFRQTEIKADMIKRYDRTSGAGSTDIKYDLKFPDLPNGTTATLATLSDRAPSIKGSYTGSGGKQNPNYFGTSTVGALMMNTTVNGDSHYKDWLIMDCYGGNDVGGAVAMGVDRQEMRAFIMGSDADRSSWKRSAELITTNHINSFKKSTAVTHTGWNGNATDDYIVPTMSFMAYWNGAYNSSGSSNLAYCSKGAFGDLVNDNAGSMPQMTSNDVEHNFKQSNFGDPWTGVGCALKVRGKLAANELHVLDTWNTNVPVMQKTNMWPGYSISFTVTPYSVYLFIASYQSSTWQHMYIVHCNSNGNDVGYTKVCGNFNWSFTRTGATLKASIDATRSTYWLCSLIKLSGYPGY